MNKKVQFVTGLLSGVIFPAIAWLIFDVIYKNSILPDRPATPYLITIAINLFIVRYFIRNNKESTGYGLITSTFIIAMIVFIFKLRP